MYIMLFLSLSLSADYNHSIRFERYVNLSSEDFVYFLS